MSEWWIEFSGHCCVEANTREEAIAKLYSLNPHDGRVYDDDIDINVITEIKDE